MGVPERGAPHQVHIAQEVLRPRARVHKVLAVVILLPARRPSCEGPPGPPPSSAVAVRPSAWSPLWQPYETSHALLHASSHVEKWYDSSSFVRQLHSSSAILLQGCSLNGLLFQASRHSCTTGGLQHAREHTSIEAKGKPISVAHTIRIRVPSAPTPAPASALHGRPCMPMHTETPWPFKDARCLTTAFEELCRFISAAS